MGPIWIARLAALAVFNWIFTAPSVGATDTVATVMEKVFCGYPLDEGTVSLGDGYATNLEILMGCVLQWVVFFAVYRTKYKQWPSFIFSKVKDKEGHFVIKTRPGPDEAEKGEANLDETT
ncbi:hypothetical protein DdX_11068 [Ditylenchus destructor]|uniref:Uncharacterized protein n=1 Tax=Ditylenchus destructor TaxID=166010 RepID=A0AAD4MYK7_9BILA|nr:hypothetical protein DdX_11068 [Ditylenchus destructor]